MAIEALDRAAVLVSVSSRRVTVILAAASALTVIALAAVRAVDGPSLPALLLQAAFVLAFVALAVVDFRTSVAFAIFELVLAGAGGEWTRFPGGVDGRIVVVSVVILRAATILLADWRRTRCLFLGRYGLHALALAVVLPLFWGALGLVRGYLAGDVFEDLNGVLFFAFVLPLVALIRADQGSWLRKVFFAACAANAVVFAALILATGPGPADIDGPLRYTFMHRLDMGGVVGTMPNGAYRLFLGSSLYVPIGLVLTAWRLLAAPHRVWLWLLWALLWLDLAASYTRGLWVSGVFAVGLTLALGARGLARPAVIAAGTVAGFLVVGAIAVPARFSLRDYLFNRAATIASVEVKPAEEATEADRAGVVSNAVRTKQAKILLRHIQERPLFGYGFGAVAAEYRPGGRIITYELSYLHIAFKAGIVGLLIYLSFPLRLLLDGVRGRLGRYTLPAGVGAREAAVIVAVLSSVLLAGASNPYILGALGVLPMLISVAWLDRPPREAA
jgi:hypothetical protein